MRTVTFGSRPQWYLLLRANSPFLSKGHFWRGRAPCLSSTGPLPCCPSPCLWWPCPVCLSASALLSPSAEPLLQNHSCRTYRGSWVFGVWSLIEAFWKRMPYRFVDYVPWWCYRGSWSSVLECGLMIAQLSWTKSSRTTPGTSSSSRPGNATLN